MEKKIVQTEHSRTNTDNARVYVWWYNGRAANVLVVMYTLAIFLYHCCTSFNNQLIRWKTKHFLSIHWIFLSYQIMTTTARVYLLFSPFLSLLVKMSKGLPIVELKRFFFMEKLYNFTWIFFVMLNKRTIDQISQFINVFILFNSSFFNESYAIQLRCGTSSQEWFN